MPERSVEIRLSVTNGAKAREDLLRMGDGEEALNKVKRGAQGASEQLNQFGISAERAARQSTARLTNLSAQVQDVIVSLQGGQPLLRVLIQQGSQIAAIFGSAGGVLGIFVAGVAALVGVYQSLRGATDAATDATEALKSATEGLDATFAGHINTIDEAIVEYRKLNDVQRELERLDVARAMRDAGTSIQQQKAHVGELITEFNNLITATGGVSGALKIIGEEGPIAFSKLIFSAGGFGEVIGKEAAADFKRFSEELDTNSIPSILDFITKVRNLIEAVPNASDKLLELDKSLGKLVEDLKLAAETGEDARKRIELLGEGAAQAALTTKELGDILKANVAFIDDLQKAARKSGEEALREAERRKEVLQTLAEELDANRRLLVAKQEGAEAVRELQVALAGEAAVRKLGKGATEEQIALARQEATENERLKQSVEDLDTARRQAAQHAANIVRQNAAFIDSLEREDRAARFRVAKELEDEQKRAAEKAADELARPFQRAADSIQDTFTDTFEKIYSGGVTTFDDLAAAIKQIMIRLAAEMTTLLIFRPGLVGGFGAAGAQAAATTAGTSAGPSLASSLGIGGAIASINAFGGRAGFAAPATTPTLPGAAPGAITGFTPATTGFFGSTATLSTLLGAGAAGALGGSILGGFFGGQGQIGGALGGGGGAALGALLGSAVPGIGTVAGGIAGGLLGSVGGGFLGSLFGGGGHDNDTGPLYFGLKERGTTTPGIFGNLIIGGENKFEEPLRKLITTFDTQIAELITTRQKAQITAALKKVPPFSGRYPEDDPTKGFETILRTRATEILKTLGLNISKILGGAGDIEEINARTVGAITVQEQIKELTKPTGIGAQLREAIAAITDKFNELRIQAKEYGIATDGLAKAQKEAIRAAKDEAQAKRDAIKAEQEAEAARVRAERKAMRQEYRTGVAGLATPFAELTAPLQAFQQQINFQQLSPAEQYQALLKDFNRISKEAKRGSLTAIGQLQGAGQALIGAAGAYGASPEIAKVTERVSSVIETVLGNLDKAQRTATAGLTGAIKRASEAQIDTLKELISETRKSVAELKKLNRKLHSTPRAA